MLRILVVEHEPGCPLDRMEGWLRQAGSDSGAPVSLVWCRPYLGDPVPAALDEGALIVLGGQHGAHDDHIWPWLPATRKLLAACVDEVRPVLGICLGAQLLATATGGLVEVGERGIEAAVVAAHWRPEAARDPLVSGLPDPFPGPSMHLDAVTRLPGDTVWLAETPLCPYQAFRVGAAAWGIQFHPEVSVATFQSWSDHHERDGDWARWELDGAAPVEEMRARDAEIAAAGRALARRFVRVIMSDARTPAGG